MKYKIIAADNPKELEKLVELFFKYHPEFKPLGGPVFSIPNGHILVQAVYCE